MGLLSYVKPKAKEAKEPKKNAKPEVVEKSSAVIRSAAPTPGFNTPGLTSGAATPTWSRPGSIYPPGGEFRNSHADDINEIKCDVMVNWLYQQQMERLWTAGGLDEGVVLKKSRGAYTCCPGDIVEEPYGFFKAVETLNVRVSIRMSQLLQYRPHRKTDNSLRLP
jgi:hypothetical protein